MAGRKAAIQLSLGLIVAVVFSIVFLSLGIIWVNQFMEQITGVTKDLIDEGKVKIRETFSETDQNFAVYPQEWELPRGSSLKMVAGIINREPDSQAHRFVINVIPTRKETEEWIDDREFNTQLKAEFGSVVDFPITITPKREAIKGTYVFYVIACMEKGFESCKSPDDQNYESAQYFRLTLT